MNNPTATCSCGVRHEHGIATETNCRHFRKNNPARTTNSHALGTVVPRKSRQPARWSDSTADMNDRAAEVDEFMSGGKEDRSMYLDDRLVLADGTEFTAEVAQDGEVPVYRELLLVNAGDRDGNVPDRNVIANRTNQEFFSRYFPESCVALDDGAFGVRVDEPIPLALREALESTGKNGGVIHKGHFDKLGKREWRKELGGPLGRHHQYRNESELEMRNQIEIEEVRHDVNPLVWPKDEPLDGDEYDAWLDKSSEAAWEATKNGQEYPENDIAYDYERAYFRQNNRRWTGHEEHDDAMRTIRQLGGSASDEQAMRGRAFLANRESFERTLGSDYAETLIRADYPALTDTYADFKRGNSSAATLYRAASQVGADGLIQECAVDRLKEEQRRVLKAHPRTRVQTLMDMDTAFRERRRVEPPKSHRSPGSTGFASPGEVAYYNLARELQDTLRPER